MPYSNFTIGTFNVCLLKERKCIQKKIEEAEIQERKESLVAQHIVIRTTISFSMKRAIEANPHGSDINIYPHNIHSYTTIRHKSWHVNAFSVWFDQFAI